MFAKDSTLNKLILLFVMEQMEIPVTENTIIDICTNRNDWLNYMECKEIIFELIQANFIYRTDGNEKEQKYTITYEGSNCLSHFYQKIPLSLREQIRSYVKENRIYFKRSQEYIGDYSKNQDGSYTVTLKIKSLASEKPLFEIIFKAQTRQNAIEACRNWKDKAHLVYEYTYETLIDDN